MFALRLPDAPTRPIFDYVRAFPKRNRFWLDGLHAHTEGRWSFAGFDPAEVRVRSFSHPSPLDLLHDLEPSDMRLEGAPDGPELSEIPHWIGYIAYDAAWAGRKRLGLRMRPIHPRLDQPTIAFKRYESMLAVDHQEQRVFVLAPDESAARQWLTQLTFADRIEQTHAGQAQVPPASKHLEAIHKALEAIAAGDIYQVNLARRWEAPFHGDPLLLFQAMRNASPVPLGFFLDGSELSVLGRSMERFLRWKRRERTLWTCPIKGTLERSGDDHHEAIQLSEDTKERAEHSMIVDLMRNDLSRVAEIGTVRVQEALRIERFTALQHMVSTVRCQTREDISAFDILEATFPPGSITGTPKLKAIETIETLEPTARGIYTGSLGHLDREGGLSLAVAIRTATVDHQRSVATYFAGGGLVSASQPEREVAETELKARVFLEALRASQS